MGNDVASGAEGALSGAGTGAIIGGTFGPHGAAVGAGVGAALGFAGGYFGGGGEETVSGLKLPAGFEFEFIDAIVSDLDAFDRNIDASQKFVDNYHQRLKVIDASLDGFIPSDKTIAVMNTLSYDLATQFGDQAQELIDSGFMLKDDLEIKKQLEQEFRNLENVRGDRLADPGQQAKLAEQRRQLQQDLSRTGTPPDQIAQALQRFDLQAETSTFQRSEDLKTTFFAQSAQILTTINTRADFIRATREGNFALAQEAKIELDNGIAMASGALESKRAIGQAIRDNRLLGIEAETNLRATRTEMFGKVGEFEFQNAKDRESSIAAYIRSREQGESKSKGGFDKFAAIKSKERKAREIHLGEKPTNVSIQNPFNSKGDTADERFRRG